MEVSQVRKIYSISGTLTLVIDNNLVTKDHLKNKFKTYCMPYRKMNTNEIFLKC